MAEETTNPKDKDPGTEFSKTEEELQKEKEEENKNQAEALKRLTKEKEELTKKNEELAKKLKPEQPTAEEETVLAMQREIRKDRKVTDFFTKNPELKEHQEEVEKRLNDPSRAQVPVDEVIRGTIPAEAWIKVGARIEKQAKEDEEKGKMGGGDATTKEPKTEEEKLSKRYMDSLPTGFKPKTTS